MGTGWSRLRSLAAAACQQSETRQLPDTTGVPYVGHVNVNIGVNIGTEQRNRQLRSPWPEAYRDADLGLTRRG